jgi:hypothetical protein
MFKCAMKRVACVGGPLVGLALWVVCGCATSPEAQRSIPTSLDVPADFKVTKADWVDHERHRVGWPLGDSLLRGKAIHERNGVFPIHVMRADIPQFGDELIQVDDLIIAVDGVPLGEDPEDQFAYEARSALKLAKPLSVTRWRRGHIATVTLDFGLLASDEQIPDLTKGGEPDETRDWTLGPIGANGWGHSQRAGHGGSSKARQLLITLVDSAGPAAGKLKVGDVILGVGGEDFVRDARRSLADAINEAEKEENGGRLTLKVWRPTDATPVDASAAEGDHKPVRKGKIVAVTLTLPVMGRYSETAPFDCPKTEKIIDNAVAYIKANKHVLLKPKEKGWLVYINGLGLMATGREDVMPMVRALAHGSLLAEGETLSVEKHVSMQCWWWSYKMAFLCEYYLRTGDEAVLPTIREHAIAIAMGQSGAGTWGHTYAARANTGYLHGHLGGYGAINQMGLTMMVVLPLAEKCGVDHPEVRAAIKRGDDFFSYFIDKGTIPYGDHGAAREWYDDNGKSGAAAIVFELLDKPKGSRFFSEMVLASAPSGREVGHTGHYWSHLWGGIGAARAGDRGLQVFMREMNPIFTLERQHNGRFAFQDNLGEKGDRGKPKAKWDCTGARLLQLCVPRRTLYITGRKTPRQTQLTKERMAQILRAGRLDIDKQARAKLSVPEILELLRDPLPPTRAVAVHALDEREINCVDQLIKMLDSPNRYARYGAAEALGKVGFASEKAANRLIQIMQTDRDTQFRVAAVNALISTNPKLGLAKVAEPAIPVLLQLAAEPAAPDDPRRVLQNDISRALFYNGHAQPLRGLLPRYGLANADRDKLIPAIRAILTNDNGGARSMVGHFIYPRLTEEDLAVLWGDIYRASRRIAPSGIMFATSVRTNGLKLMAKHGIKEGMYLAAWYIRWQKAHGAPGRVPAALEALEMYGTHAQSLIPYLQEHVEYWMAKRKPGREPGPDDTANRILATIDKIKRAEHTPTLTSIAAQLNEGDIPPRDGP